MNEWMKPSNTKLNMKVMYIALALSIGIVFVGQIIDWTHVFGKEGTLPIQIFVSVFAGVIIGIGWVKAKTGMKLVELI